MPTRIRSLGNNGIASSRAIPTALLIGIAGVLFMVLWLLFSPTSSAYVLPRSPEYYAVQPDLEIPPPAPVEWKRLPEQRHPSAGAHWPKSLLQDWARLEIRNDSTVPVTGTAGGKAFRLEPGAKVSLLVYSGQLDIRAHSPGLAPITDRVVLEPFRTYRYTLYINAAGL